MPNETSCKQLGRPPAGLPPAAAEFRHALGHFATGITVITTLDEDGVLHGLTANAVSSVSLEPPLILFCIKNTARSFGVLQRRRAFCLHILAESQTDLSNRFARGGADKWAELAPLRGKRGVPLLRGGLVTFECRTYATYEGGDH